MKFEVVHGDAVIGWTELENGDPPMGVAFGRMYPTAVYSLVRDAVPLRVRPEGGTFFQPAGGVHLEDQSAELGPEAIEVSVLGLDSTTYERHFSAHVRAYEEQFGK
jgi:hypothetical protein